jgi:sigma-54 dependent transcriptional regulator, flagellar regulatory protein
MDRPDVGAAFRVAVAQAAIAGSHIVIAGDVGGVAEQLSRDIHDQSDRKGQPYAGLRVAGQSADRLDAELFGLARGERNAPRDRTGLLALVGRGTLYLEEIGHLPMATQRRLVQVLEAGVLRTGSRELPVVARIVTSTRDGLLAQVQRGEFVSELYFRLAGVVLNVPIARATTIVNVPLDLSAQASRSATASLGDLVPLDDVERAHVTMVLQRVGGNKARAATILQIGRKTLYRKLAGWGIPLDEVASPSSLGR